jgi:hypothetical protein
MSQTKENLLYYKTVPATAENQLSLLIESMTHDLRSSGKFLLESSGTYDRAMAIANEDSFISIALFKGSNGVLS